MRMLIAGLACLLALGVARAEPDVDAWFYGGIHGGWQFFDLTDRKPVAPDNTVLPGLHLGYRFSPDWSLQGEYEKGGYELDGAAGEGDLRVARMSVQRHFPELEPAGFRPYIGVSAGDLKLNPDSGSADHQSRLGLAVGVQRPLGQRWRLDLRARQSHSLDEERRDGQLYLGLSRRFGAIDPGPSSDLGGGAEEDSGGFRVKDSDGDGVPDPLDDCPGTPDGTKVDGTGCAADSGEE